MPAIDNPVQAAILGYPLSMGAAKANMSDRHLVERLILPGMLQALMKGIMEGMGPDGDALIPVADLLGQAMREPLSEIHSGRHSKLARRAARAATAAMKSLRGDEHSIAAQWLAVARLIVMLTDDGSIVVAEGSAFDQAWTLMLEMGFGDEGVCDEVAADEMAVEMRSILALDGYFVS